MEKSHKRNIRTIKFISYTRKMTKSHQSQTFKVLEVLQCPIAWAAVVAVDVQSMLSKVELVIKVAAISPRSVP
jgi:hypothetical protein